MALATFQNPLNMLSTIRHWPRGWFRLYTSSYLHHDDELVLELVLMLIHECNKLQHHGQKDWLESCLGPARPGVRCSSLS